MKNRLWIAALVVLAALVAAQGIKAEEKAAKAEKSHHEKGQLTEVTGKVTVDGDTVKIVTADGVEYILGKRSAAAYKDKAGQSVTVKGWVREKDGKKMLGIPQPKKAE